MSADILRILVVLLGIGLVAVVLIQQPKEGGMSAFTGGGGGGASGTVFGAKGSGSFLFKLTGGLALAFAVAISVLVSISNKSSGGAVLSDEPAISTEVIPGADNIPASAEAAIPGVAIPGADNLQTPATETIPGASENQEKPQE